MKKENSKLAEKITTYLFYLSAFLFFIAFNFQDSKTGGWYQQWLPNLNGRALSDITFSDSLTGFAVTPYVALNDTGFVVKTTDGGDNWFINTIFTGQYSGFNRVVFLNSNTGFIVGNSGMYKTTNSGNNWIQINKPNQFFIALDISLLNSDTFLVCHYDSFDGGLFKTTNDGLNWTRLYYQTSSNPERIYMYNERIGFMMAHNNSTMKTTDGGNNWFQVIANHGFTDIHFSDSLTGWIARPYKTTDGGMNWIDHYSNLPKIFQNVFYQMSKFSKDTIWGVGGSEYYNGYRAVLYITTNGGNNWGYQRLDTSVHAFRYEFCNFVNKLNGWAYYLTGSGIHTVVGGNDTTIYTGVNNISSFVSKDFILYQNYPNPFNSMTNVKVQMLKQGFAEIKIFDLTGRLINTIINKKLSSGMYNVKFDGSNLSSGIYFYTLFVDGVRIDTKKAILIK
jgi:photosystem II stability/assembly factor-like uncharacterized protein